MFTHPLFVNVEFLERAGAFFQFMMQVKGLASLCYFNYEYSGERVGRALVGMEFVDAGDRKRCLDLMEEMVGGDIRDVKVVGEETLRRLLG